MGRERSHDRIQSNVTPFGGHGQTPFPRPRALEMLTNARMAACSRSSAWRCSSHLLPFPHADELAADCKRRIGLPQLTDDPHSHAKIMEHCRAKGSGPRREGVAAWRPGGGCGLRQRRDGWWRACTALPIAAGRGKGGMQRQPAAGDPQRQDRSPGDSLAEASAEIRGRGRGRAVGKPLPRISPKKALIATVGPVGTGTFREL
jgi:hypothetical protein